MKRLSIPRPAPLLAALVALSLPALGAGKGWTTDYEAAKKQAAKEKKDLLIDFTGSDWCVWCKRLKAEVFDHEEFSKGVADKYVLVELDFPRDQARIDGKIMARNQKLAKLYAIRGYPTIILADAKGRPFAQTGYQEGGPSAYLKHLGELQGNKSSRDKALEEANKLKGVEKAEALQAAISKMADEAADQFFPELVEAIVKADPKDETGFVNARNTRKAMGKLENSLDTFFGIGQFELAIKEVDKFIKDNKPEGEMLQQVLMPKVTAYVQLGDKEKAFEVIEVMRKADPKSELSGQLDLFKTRIADFIEKQAAEKKAKEGEVEEKAPEKKE